MVRALRPESLQLSELRGSAGEQQQQQKTSGHFVFLESSEPRARGMEHTAVCVEIRESPEPEPLREY